MKKNNTTPTLFSAFNSLLRKARNAELSNEFYADAKKELKFIGDMLQLTPIQCILLGIILERTASGITDLDDISSFLDTSNMSIFEYLDDLEELRRRHLIRVSSRHCNDGWIVPKEVINCFRRNENYVYSNPVCTSNSDLYNELDTLVSSCSDDEMSADDCIDDVLDLLHQNASLSMAKCLLRCHDKLPSPEFRTLLGVAMYWMRHNENEVRMNMVGFLLESRHHVNRIDGELAGGSSPLIQHKMMRTSTNGEVNVRNTYCLTSQFKKQLYPELCAKHKGNAQMDSHLKPFDLLVEKPMFYNPGEAEQVSRLHNLLKPENMTSVLQRLNDRKMRGGFSILLYGGPGTGKTETVHQLAKASGRALFVVQMDQMRSKWYGESEKLVKGLFDDYRKCVKESKVAPILFFNEADALFNRRMENAERSVDKGENALQNIILQEMENLDGILIATTNLATSLDPAFERRFIYKLELTKPSRQVKSQIWRSMIPSLSESEADTLSQRYDFSGGQIENIMRKGTVEEILTGNTMTFNQWCSFCDQELIGDSNKRSIGFCNAK